jgi:hypothetical protein
MRKSSAAAGIAAGAILVLAGATQADAASYDGPCNATTTSCTTGSLQVGSSHTITVNALTLVGGGNFKLIDSSNGVVVWEKGLGNFQNKYYPVNGLYSSYYCTVRNAGPGAGCALFTS